jgi:hypothetical protein
MATTVMVAHATRLKLKEKKHALGLKNMDDVILHLLGEHGEEGASASGGAERRKRAREADAAGDEKRVPQVLSYELVSREPAAVKWLTGLKPEALNWTMGALKDAVTCCSARLCFACCALQTRNRALIMSSLTDICDCLP